ncbi:hypothetical protein Tco_0622756, partial [Tanacetum coccineum]
KRGEGGGGDARLSRGGGEGVRKEPMTMVCGGWDSASIGVVETCGGVGGDDVVEVSVVVVSVRWRRR